MSFQEFPVVKNPFLAKIRKTIVGNNIQSLLLKSSHYHNQEHNAKPRVLFTQLHSFALVNGVPLEIPDFNGVDHFIESAKLRYPTLCKIPDDALYLNFIALMNVPGPDTRLTELAYRELGLILAHPDDLEGYNSFALSYLYILLAKGHHFNIIREDDRDIVRAGAEVIVKAFNDANIATFDRERETAINLTFTTLIMMVSLQGVTGKEPELEYWKPAEQNCLEGLLAVGFTHVEIFKLLAGMKDKRIEAYFLNYTDKRKIKLHLEYVLGLVDPRAGEWLKLIGLNSYRNDQYVSPLIKLFWATLHPDPIECEAIMADHLRDATRHIAFRRVGAYEDPSNENEHPLRAITEDLHPGGMVKLITIDVFRWVCRHTQWYNSESVFTGTTGIEITMHHHTVIAAIMAQAVPEDDNLAGFDQDFTPAEFIAHFSKYITKSVNTQISLHVGFPESPYTFVDKSVFVQELGAHEDIAFKQIMSTTDLKHEGHLMHHCIGGYGKTFASGNDFAYHITSNVNVRGYTLHLRYDPVRKTTDIVELRGLSNKAVTGSIRSEIKAQLENHKYEEESSEG